MITFLWIGAALILLVGVFFVATGATRRKRTAQSGQAVVSAQEEGSGKPKVARATGTD